ncbi:MAG: nucleotidyltransferase family protein [Clostridia bacterium]|nr:nucleotidyltransferase family protein [Clostridia bacterium]
MKICAVICEYNPFHLGHAYQLSALKEQSAVIAVMSGSFTQRGDAAVLSKYDRAEIAVRSGADLVLELPFPYSSASAEIFGRAGVRIANTLGCVDTLCFGSETGDTEALLALSDRLRAESFQSALTDYLLKNKKCAYRTSVAEVYRLCYGEAFPQSGSNDILSLSYLSALKDLESSIVPLALMRKGEQYNGGGSGFASATTVRTHIMKRDWDFVFRNTPEVTANMLFSAAQKGSLADSEKLFALFASLVRTRGESVFEDIYDISDELAARLCTAGIKAKNAAEFLNLAVSRNDSPSRVRRAVLSTLMNVKKEDVGEVPYTSVLAANETGRKILSAIRKKSEMPIITKPADAKQYGNSVARAAKLCACADSVWELICDFPREGNAMIKEKPRML